MVKLLQALFLFMCAVSTVYGGTDNPLSHFNKIDISEEENDKTSSSDSCEKQIARDKIAKAVIEYMLHAQLSISHEDLEFIIDNILNGYQLQNGINIEVIIQREINSYITGQRLLTSMSAMRSDDPNNTEVSSDAIPEIREPDSRHLATNSGQMEVDSVDNLLVEEENMVNLGIPLAFGSKRRHITSSVRSKRFRPRHSLLDRKHYEQLPQKRRRVNPCTEMFDQNSSSQPQLNSNTETEASRIMYFQNRIADEIFEQINLLGVDEIMSERPFVNYPPFMLLRLIRNRYLGELLEMPACPRQQHLSRITNIISYALSNFARNPTIEMAVQIFEEIIRLNHELIRNHNKLQ